MSDIKATIAAVSLAPGSTIRDAMAAIDRGGLGLALIVEPGTEAFVGLVTDGDIRRALLDGQGLSGALDDVPRPGALTASIDTPSDQLATLLSSSIHSLPLLDDQGRVADIAIFDNRARLPVAEPMFGERELFYVSECVLTGWVSSAGSFVTRFEEMFAEFCGTREAVALCNGTAALHLALVALGVGPGDEVIVPSLTFISTANAVRFTGATPVLVDSEPTTWNLDPEQVERAMSPRTKAIIPVHLYGHPADMDPIMATAEAHGVPVIEDAAEAHGAVYRDRVVGSIGRMGCFSFYGNKVITTGEGGMIVCDDPELAARLRVLRAHGMSKPGDYRHEELGYNYRLTNLQAALGVGQMERIDQILAAKQEVARLYGEGLRGIPGITLPPDEAWATNIFWLYSILVDGDEYGMTRDELMTQLSAVGIETRPIFLPIHKQPLYDEGLSLPVSERLWRTGLSLPSAATLRPEDVRRVTEAVAGFASLPA